VKIANSDAIILWSEKAALFGVIPLICFRTSGLLLWNLFRFSNFSIVMDTNVNKLFVSRIHDISRTMDH